MYAIRSYYESKSASAKVRCTETHLREARVLVSMLYRRGTQHRDIHFRVYPFGAGHRTFAAERTVPYPVSLDIVNDTFDIALAFIYAVTVGTA